MAMGTLLRQRLQSRHALPSGFTLLEPLILSVLLLVAMGATAAILIGVNRTIITTQQQVVMQASIDDNLRQIKGLARTYTCCSGVCTTTPPTVFGVINGVTQACATNNPMSSRYYYPQVSVTNVSGEQVAVDQICRPSSNTAFMTPFKTAVDNLPQPENATRSTTIQLDRMLRVSFTDDMNNDRVTRVVNITPQMAFYCT